MFLYFGPPPPLLNEKRCVLAQYIFGGKLESLPRIVLTINAQWAKVSLHALKKAHKKVTCEKRSQLSSTSIEHVLVEQPHVFSTILRDVKGLRYQFILFHLSEHQCHGKFELRPES